MPKQMTSLMAVDKDAAHGHWQVAVAAAMGDVGRRGEFVEPCSIAKWSSHLCPALNRQSSCPL
jgi:hypothetical protein